MFVVELIIVLAELYDKASDEILVITDMRVPRTQKYLRGLHKNTRPSLSSCCRACMIHSMHGRGPLQGIHYAVCMETERLCGT